MAGFRTHVTVSGALGVVYGGVAVQPLGFSTETAVLAAGLTTVGGMLPDLDSQSGVPVRELFGLAAVVVPLTLIPRMVQQGVSQEGILATLLFGYVVIRYGASRVFKRLTVHRGMFHSIPAMLIAGLVVYLGYHSPGRPIRLLFAGGVMVGFFSHLLLDELYSVDFNGVRVKLNQFAGTAVKFMSPSVPATATCYALLGGLMYLAYTDYAAGEHDPPHRPARVTGAERP
ncbi:MAG: metal-dependent hydrolase [Gemmataceae bacterium]|nr:metal-dependent hydrolase [Gemmataceae bacterium]